MAETKYQIKLQDLATAELKKIQEAMKAIENSTGDARKEFKQLEESTKYAKKLEAQLAETRKESSALAEIWKKIDPTGFAGATLVANGLVAAGQAAVQFAKDSVKEFTDAQQSMAKLSALTLAAGDSFSFTSGQLNDMANQMQSSLAIDDDLIRGAEGILVSFQNISGEAFPRALQAAADLSGVFGSLDSASTALGKALSNPTEGLAALQRIGVQFTAKEKDRLKVLMDGNDLLGAQDFLLDKVEKRFRGTAKAMADSAAGDLKKADLAMKDLQEAFGGLIAVPLAGMATGITSLFNAMSGAGPSLATTSLADLKAGVLALQTQMDSGSLTAMQYADALEVLRGGKNSIAGREHSYGQAAPAGAVILTAPALKANAQAEKDAKDAYDYQSKLWNEFETNDVKEVARLKGNADAKAALDYQTGLMNEFEANDAAAVDKQNADHQAAVDLQSSWLEDLDNAGIQYAADATDRAKEVADAEEEHRQLVAQRREAGLVEAKAQQTAFRDSVISDLQSLGNAWETLSQRQIQSQIAAKEAQIKTIEDGLSELENEYSAELALKKAKGENTTAFEVENLENIKKAKAAAKVEEDKLREEEKNLKRQAFEQDKAYKSAQALMAGAVAIMQGYASMGPFALPWAIGMGAVTAAEIAVIQSQSMPALAEGGVIPATPGGRVVRVAEAGMAEAVIPLDRFGGLGGDSIVININGIQFQDAADLAEEIYRQTARLKRVGKIT